MDLITTTAVYNMHVPMRHIIHSLSDVGFRKLDLAFDYCMKNDFVTNRWEKWVYEVKDYAEEMGVEFVQAHGIGDICRMQYNVEERNLAYRVLSASEILGIKCVVMHPYDTDFSKTVNVEEYVENNARMLAQYLKKCEELGICLAIENLPWSNSAHAEALVQLVERMDSDYVGICWDTGHSYLLGQDVREVEKLGKFMVTMHAHDNFARLMDEHLIPYDGSYDWHQFCCL